MTKRSGVHWCKLQLAVNTLISDSVCVKGGKVDVKEVSSEAELFLRNPDTLV